MQISRKPVCVLYPPIVSVKFINAAFMRSHLGGVPATRDPCALAAILESLGIRKTLKTPYSSVPFLLKKKKTKKMYKGEKTWTKSSHASEK